MKVVVAGSRSCRDYTTVERAINDTFNTWMSQEHDQWQLFIQPEIVSGGAYGVDFFGERYAQKHKLPLKIFPADWDKHGKKAGILRNIEMGKYADRLIAIWDGSSKGTQHMITYMRSLEKPVYVVNYTTKGNECK